VNGPDDQLDQWSRTYQTRTDFLGADASEPARMALERFAVNGASEVLELGAGQGRDTLLFASAGMHVVALDYAAEGLDRIRERAQDEGVAGRLETCIADVRLPLPFDDAAFDAGYAHMLLSMALTTDEVLALATEVRRVLRPNGLFVYTVRNTSDAHYRQGASHGDDRYEMGGFIVHFFDRTLIERAAAGFELVDVVEMDEGRLPRRLSAVTMRRVP
jgi:SAM-dependent methyltransferase